MRNVWLVNSLFEKTKGNGLCLRWWRPSQMFYSQWKNFLIMISWLVKSSSAGNFCNNAKMSSQARTTVAARKGKFEVLRRIWRPCAAVTPHCSLWACLQGRGCCRRDLAARNANGATGVATPPLSLVPLGPCPCGQLLPLWRRGRWPVLVLHIPLSAFTWPRCAHTCLPLQTRGSRLVPGQLLLPAKCTLFAFSLPSASTCVIFQKSKRHSRGLFS